MAKNRYKRAEKVFPISLGPGDRAFEPHYSDQGMIIRTTLSKWAMCSDLSFLSRIFCIIVKPHGLCFQAVWLWMVVWQHLLDVPSRIRLKLLHLNHNTPLKYAPTFVGILQRGVATKYIRISYSFSVNRLYNT